MIQAYCEFWTSCRDCHSLTYTPGLLAFKIYRLFLKTYVMGVDNVNGTQPI